MPEEPAAWIAVHIAARALAPLRAGLTADAARGAAPHLRQLLNTPAVALTAGTDLLAWVGSGSGGHGRSVAAHAAGSLDPPKTRVVAVDCGRPACPVRHVITAPLLVADRAVGVLCAYARTAPPGLVRATTEVAGWISGQLELAAGDRARARRDDATRPHLSAHFVFNSLTAVMSFIRTDPDRAMDLLQEFADVIRYSFRRHCDVATVKEELRAIEQYLALEQVRFADRLRVTVQVAAEALPASVPFLSLQPLVDNAIRHGVERKAGPGRISIVVAPVGTEIHLSVEDDGVGVDDVDDLDDGIDDLRQRLRRGFGDAGGLAVETTPGTGTRVTVRVPKDGPVTRRPPGT